MYRHLIGLDIERAVLLLKDTLHKIVEYNSDKLKEFDRKIVINVKQGEVLVLYVGNFLFNVKED